MTQASEAFAQRLSATFPATHALLETKKGYAFESFADVAGHGEQLEHFHSYNLPMSKAPNSPLTLEMHTDQGLFIAFTPAMMLDRGTGQPRAEAVGDFYIELPSGVRLPAKFDDNSLVFMLGDGVDQFVNPNLPRLSKPLRATPHAFSMPAVSSDVSRAWYGRMFLAPSAAIHQEHGTTYGQVRQLLVDETRSGRESAERMGLGCSGDKIAVGRELQTCAAGTIYCWNRCMNATEDRGVFFGISEDICQAQGLQLQCTDILDRVYDPSFDRHGDYFPACTNSTQLVDSDLPSLPGYPRNMSICTDADWAVWSDTAGYTHSYELGSNGFVMWNVLGTGASRRVQLKMVYNALMGYLGIGFRNTEEGAGKMGMQGANVVLALPGADYTLKYGLNLSQPGSVQEYKIHDVQSRFRFWEGSGQPQSGMPEHIPTVTQHLNNTAYTKGACFGSMSFETSQIGETAFNWDGADEIIWSANTENNFVEAHGRSNRGIVSLNWQTGGSVFTAHPPPPNPKPPPPMPPAFPSPMTPAVSLPSSPLALVSDDLSSGAVAGIAVGSVFAGLGLLAAILVNVQGTGAKDAGKTVTIDKGAQA